MYFHILCQNSSDYEIRREMAYPRHLPNALLGETYREVHVRLHMARTDAVIAAGPTLNGKYAHMFYRANDRATMNGYLEADPYTCIGAWQNLQVRRLSFMIHAERVPPRLDGARRVMAVSGRLDDVDIVATSLTVARDSGWLIAGGITEDNEFVGWVNTIDRDFACDRLADHGISLSNEGAHEVIWVL
jgi:uncharacterized protein YciI